MKGGKRVRRVVSSLKKGDPVMVIAGGNKHKRPLKGQVGKIVRFAGKKRDRVIIEGLNLVTKNRRQTAPDKPSGQVQQEAGIHISNVMYYVEKIKKPVRIKHQLLADGKKVRGYKDPESGEFVQLAD
ncbi:MAG: 50S ribosomal protein L24 [Candidatus Dadabacteria bacterium]|nr:MAG: 50S ribosomal protein L24 [Candidatus Dadabacteria bacterium]